MAPPSPRSRASLRPLPLDALYEVLLRVPAKDLCRLRAVCRPWRSLLSDAHFIAAHAARHPDPLIVAGCNCNIRRPGAGHLLDIMDLSGRVIKGIGAVREVCAVTLTAQLDAVCVLLDTSMSYLLLNTVTGAVSALPQGFAEEHPLQARDISCYMHLVAVGKVASTGEYKVLRLLRSYFQLEHLCEVFTINGSNHARWRGKKATPERIDLRKWSRVSVNGIVYFLSRELVMHQHTVPLRLASFDLETEEWRAILLGPPDLDLMHIDFDGLSVVSLNGCLVVVHWIRSSSMDLWFLMDFENGSWVKQHSIQLKLSFCDYTPVLPFLVLNDGRILTYIRRKGWLRIYDPITCTYTDVAKIGPHCEIGLYTENLLSLPDGAAAAQLMR